MAEVCSVPFNLYFELEKGRSINWETVTDASQEFINGVRDIAFIVDPTMKVRFELINGAEGSLSLNALITALKSKSTKAKLLLLVKGVGFWFSLLIADYVVEHSLDALNIGKIVEAVVSDLGEEDKKALDGLSKAEKERLFKMLESILKTQKSNPHYQKFYRSVDRDKAITGVGLGSKHNSRPKYIVPKEKFKEQYETIEDLGTTQIRSVQTRLILVAPFLEPGTKRRWKFRGPFGEFGATIEDKDLINDILSGRKETPMVAGIEIEVILDIKTKITDGKPVAPTYSIPKVISIHPPMTQTTFDNALST